MPRMPLGLVLLTAAASAGPAQEKTAVATFAGERFWSMQADFDHVPGVISTSSGYAGGRVVANPTCAQVSDAGTGHAESVDGPYDPAKVSYVQLLAYYWQHVDPSVKDRQFCGVGRQYRTTIFGHGTGQRELAKASKQRVQAELKKSIYAGPFKGKDYHQDFYKKEFV